MNEASTVMVGSARPTVRKMNRNELLNALPTDLRHSLVEEESDPREVGLRYELVGWVAEATGTIDRGSPLCSAQSPDSLPRELARSRTWPGVFGICGARAVSCPCLSNCWMSWWNPKPTAQPSRMRCWGAW